MTIGKIISHDTKVNLLSYSGLHPDLPEDYIEQFKTLMEPYPYLLKEILNPSLSLCITGLNSEFFFINGLIYKSESSNSGFHCKNTITEKKFLQLFMFCTGTIWRDSGFRLFNHIHSNHNYDFTYCVKLKDPKIEEANQDVKNKIKPKVPNLMIYDHINNINDSLIDFKYFLRELDNFIKIDTYQINKEVNNLNLL